MRNNKSGGRAGKRRAEAAPREEGGFFVIMRLDGRFWSGEDWVDGWGTAKQFPPAPDRGWEEADAEAGRLREAGHDCFVLDV